MNRNKKVKCTGTAYLDVYKKEIDFKVSHCHEPVHNDINFTGTSEIIDHNNQNIGDNFQTFNSNSATDSNLVINQNVSDNLEIDAVMNQDQMLSINSTGTSSTLPITNDNELVDQETPVIPVPLPRKRQVALSAKQFVDDNTCLICDIESESPDEATKHVKEVHSETISSYKHQFGGESCTTPMNVIECHGCFKLLCL